MKTTVGSSVSLTARINSPAREGARVAGLMRKAGLECGSLHLLRHRHASSLLSLGVPIAVVLERLGHAGHASG